MRPASSSRNLAVLTSTRADYGLWRPLLTVFETRGTITPQLVVTGTHLEAHHGRTIAEIRRDGRKPWREIPLDLVDDAPATATRAIARLAEALGDLFADPDARPDALALLGDRFELLGAASAALVAGIPIFHIHGGEVTEGAFDDAIRHAVSKMAALHFVTTAAHGRRLLQMGEPEERVHVVGALGVDAICKEPPLPEAALCRMLGLAGSQLPRPLVVVTWHPVTRDRQATRRGLEALLTALAGETDLHVVWTAPNADPGADEIRTAAREFARRHAARAVFLDSLGHRGYASLLRHAVAVLGNSSSGILEAPAIPTATIDIGSRQQGRPKAASVISCPEDATAIAAALKQVRDPAFRAALAGISHPFGDGRAAERIADVLEGLPDWSALVAKPFCDRIIEGGTTTGGNPEGEEVQWAAS
ncbi:MAG: UDP-N-acetylglucosamine 2-epimerase (hydrolyzing) [Alphaproteobacteria bacterium]|nr:MAG: UDP-N-acetylglucosamine 2-epimerase (hydrolyzing) [Alphaproteobacteria bacterium]